MANNEVSYQELGFYKLIEKKNWRNFQFQNFTILRFEVMWLGYKKDILKFVGMVALLNISSKNIIEHFK